MKDTLFHYKIQKYGWEERELTEQDHAEYEFLEFLVILLYILIPIVFILSAIFGIGLIGKQPPGHFYPSRDEAVGVEAFLLPLLLGLIVIYVKIAKMLGY